MRIIVSFLFIFITILSVIRPVDSFCLSKIHASEVKPDSIQAGSEVKNDLDSSSASTKHLSCDVCHIGHCSFVIASNFETTKFGKTKLFGFVKAKIQSSDFNQNLFRPPIV